MRILSKLGRLLDPDANAMEQIRDLLSIAIIALPICHTMTVQVQQ